MGTSTKARRSPAAREAARVAATPELVRALLPCEIRGAGSFRWANFTSELRKKQMAKRISSSSRSPLPPCPVPGARAVNPLVITAATPPARPLEPALPAPRRFVTGPMPQALEPPS